MLKPTNVAIALISASAGGHANIVKNSCLKKAQIDVHAQIESFGNALQEAFSRRSCERCADVIRYRAQMLMLAVVIIAIHS